MSSLEDEYKKYKITTKISQFFEECSLIKNQIRKIPIIYALICSN
jgi:hypothetical protein